MADSASAAAAPRFGFLPAINTRDKAADDMSDCFDFSQKPLAPPAPAI